MHQNPQGSTLETGVVCGLYLNTAAQYQHTGTHTMLQPWVNLVFNFVKFLPSSRRGTGNNSEST